MSREYKETFQQARACLEQWRGIAGSHSRIDRVPIFLMTRQPILSSPRGSSGKRCARRASSPKRKR